VDVREALFLKTAKHCTFYGVLSRKMYVPLENDEGLNKKKHDIF
jgi:hypothetical protein